MIEIALIFVSFAIIVALVGMKKDINIALISGAAVMLFYFAGSSIVDVIVKTVKDERTIFLLTTSFTISVLAELYKKTGAISEFSRAMAAKIRSPKAILALVPAVLGLLPIAGGALMSAPIVETIGTGIGMSQDLMIFLNVWFRHYLFLFYPMGQSIIVASATMGISPVELGAIQIPIAAFMVTYGLLFTRKYKGSFNAEITYKMGIWKSGGPMLIAIAASLVLNYFVGNYGIPLGILLGIFTLLVSVKPGWGALGETLRSKMVLSLTLSAFSIMLLQHSITDTRASEVISEAIKSSSIPIIFLETIIPGILSALTSSTVTGIVTVAPILSSLRQLTIFDASIIYTSSFISYTISPTHLCLIYTARYFNRGVGGSYKYMLPAAAFVLIFTILYYFVLFPTI
jgi:integral membrane protein (TIGR00529 family)